MAKTSKLYHFLFLLFATLQWNWLISGPYTHRSFHSRDSKKRSRDNKHLLARVAKVCGFTTTVVANFLKVPSSREIFSMPRIYASVELFSVTYLGLNLAKSAKLKELAWKQTVPDTSSPTAEIYHTHPITNSPSRDHFSLIT